MLPTLSAIADAYTLKMVREKVFLFVVMGLAAFLVASVVAEEEQVAGKMAADAPAQASEGGVSGAVLLVNNGAVTSGEVIKAIEKELGKWATAMSWGEFEQKARPAIGMVLREKVFETLLYQHARAELEKASNYEMVLESALAERRKGLLAEYDGSLARAEAELAERGTTLEEELEQIKRQLIIGSYREKYLAGAREVTRIEMYQYYQAHQKDKYTANALIQFQLIDLPGDAAEGALEIWRELEAGGDFGDLAQQYSQGFRKEAGGLWRLVEPNSLQAKYQPVTEALAKIEPGQYTGVIVGDDRFFVAKLIDRQEGKVTGFAEAQAEIEQTIVRQRLNKHFFRLQAELLEKATIADANGFVAKTLRAAYEQLSNRE